LAKMGIPVALYVPNLLGYARIMLALAGLHASIQHPWTAFSLWILSASLDLIDGILARALKQTSKFGVLLDIGADNFLRSCVWVAAAVSNPAYLIPSTIILCLEWCTMLATQLHAEAHRSHWKNARQKDPIFIQAFFANNFRNPLGLLGIYGLFGGNILAYASSHTDLSEKLPCFGFFKYLAFAGRGIAMGIELWMCSDYLSLVLRQDAGLEEDTGQGHKKVS
jgi:CDP-diacylglycerol--inositol 3-phosphatidyltransferase